MGGFSSGFAFVPREVTANEMENAGPVPAPSNLESKHIFCLQTGRRCGRAWT